MKFISILLICFFTFFSPSNPQHCYRRCNCRQRSLQNNHCSKRDITDLSIYFETKEITIYCKKMISNNLQLDNTYAFNASYLSFIDDKSPLTLQEMIGKCHKSKEGFIKYAVDAKNITIDDNNPIKHLKILGLSVPIHQEINVSIVGPQFGANLETLIVNQITLPNLNHYINNINNIKVLDLTANKIDNLPENVFANLQSLTSIYIKQNNIKNLKRSMFDGSTNITTLDLSNNKIEDLDSTTFSNLTEMKYLSLSNNKLKIIKTDTFASMYNLEYLDLSKNRNLTFPENVFQDLSSLTKLNLSGCSLIQIPEILFQGGQNLEIINISRNEISILEDNTFQNLSSLTILDLSYNKLEKLSSVLLQSLNTLNKLQHLYLGSNRLKTFSSEMFWSIDSLISIDLNSNLISTFHTSLGRFTVKQLNLRNNQITRFPAFLLYNVVNLEFLDLSDNKIPSVEFIKDLIPKSCNMDINLSNNIVKELNITPIEYTSETIDDTNWNITLNLAKNYLKCNCDRFSLEISPKNQQDLLLRVKNKETFCINSARNPQCPLVHIKNCPEKCLCYFQELDTAIVVDCSFRNLTKFPQIMDLISTHHLHQHMQTIVTLKGNKLNYDGQERLESYDNVTNLDLSSNNISQLKWVPKYLLNLSLENNRLTTMDQEVIEALDNITNLKWITLHDNPWNCDCRANYLQKFIRDNNNLKLDPSKIICSNTNEKLLHAEICQPTTNYMKLALPVGLTTFLAIISILLALYFKYNTNIKIYLYSKNLCLWFVAEEEIDREKTYDIFISYSHKDEHFVQKELLPGLENSESPFKICIHYRDWKVGEFISKQIIDSVLDSRRTLVVLSNNFMESVWGKMEFRTAHMQAINEGRARVIVVIYEDLDESILDDEMKAYLNTNTYVKWGDPWFWSKLKYALPHSKHRFKNLPHESLESFHLRDVS